MHNQCQMCGGQGQELGTLGTLTHFRCLQCGIIFAGTSEDEEYTEDADLDEDELDSYAEGGWREWGEDEFPKSE